MPYLVFEYLDGKDVSDLVKKRVLGPADTIRLGIDVATGLKFLHEHGVIHCDIKPRNLLWTDHGCKIIDFNVAVTAESSLSRAGGTAKYAPPDQNRSAPPNASDLMDRDVYGLGVTLYQVLTGAVPFPARCPVARRDRRRSARAARELKDLSRPVRGVAPEGHRAAARRTGTEAPRSSWPRSRRSARCTAGPCPEPADTAMPLPDPAAPNVNPFVAHLQSLYSQSPASNAGTRGSDGTSAPTCRRPSTRT